jgi:hypothetical protein
MEQKNKTIAYNNININTKNKACDKLKQIEQLNYIPIYPLEGVLNVDIDNVFVIMKIKPLIQLID